MAKRYAIGLLALVLLLAFRLAVAGYPEKPVKMIVPFTPAGATDLLARVIGEQLGKQLGQPVVIENRPGAGANVGAEIAAHAPGDGYTLLMGPASVYAISATLYPRLGYDLGKDLVPVALVANVPHVLLVNNDQPVKSVADLIALAKKENGALNIASQGSGTVSHLEAELLKSMTGADMTHVPYRGSAPALLDLMGGRVQVFFDSIASALPHIRAGKVRAIAVAAATRSPLLPDLPAVAESIPGYSAHSWLGVFVPAGTPKRVIDRLQHEVVLVVEDPRTRAKLLEAGFEPKSSSSEAFAKLVREEIDKWRPIVRQSGAQPD